MWIEQNEQKLPYPFFFTTEDFISWKSKHDFNNSTWNNTYDNDFLISQSVEKSTWAKWNEGRGLRNEMTKTADVMKRSETQENEIYP